MNTTPQNNADISPIRQPPYERAAVVRLPDPPRTMNDATQLIPSDRAAGFSLRDLSNATNCTRSLIRSACITLCLLAFAGCSEIHGTWERIRVMPPDQGDQLPFTEMTFRKDGSFNGVETIDGAEYPIDGRYEWWGDEIDIITDGVTTNYPAHKTIDGKLVISHTENLSDITIVLKRTGPAN